MAERWEGLLEGAAAQLIGSFAPLTARFAAVLSIMFALVYGLFAYLLFKGETGEKA